MERERSAYLLIIFKMRPKKNKSETKKIGYPRGRESRRDRNSNNTLRIPFYIVSTLSHINVLLCCKTKIKALYDVLRDIW